MNMTDHWRKGGYAAVVNRFVSGTDCKLTVDNGGVVVPAHVDRPSYSIISQLGFVPSSLNIRVLEYSHKNEYIVSKMQDYQRIISSDAHTLGDILEREMFLDIDDVSLTAIIQWLTCPCVI